MADGPPAGLDTLFVFHLGGVGGPARSLMPIATALARVGGVTTIVPGEGPVAADYAALGPVAIGRYEALTFPRGPLELVRLGGRLVREVRSFRRVLRWRPPDLVVVATTTLPAVLIAARLERIPAVVYAAELFQQEWRRSPLLELAGRVLAGATARLAAGVVCCSAAVARQFGERGSKPIAVAYPPIGEEYAGGDRGRGRAMLGVEAADPCLVVAGALSRGRGQDVALRALALARERLPGARLVLVGEAHPRAADRAYAEELRALAVELGIADAVVFAGAIDSMADVYAAADIVVNPARFSEPFGRVAPEALAAGRPVVASRVGALEEVIRDGVDGMLVPPDDPAALARVLCGLSEESARRERLVQAGRERTRSRFAPAANTSVWVEVLARVGL